MHLYTAERLKIIIYFHTENSTQETNFYHVYGYNIHPLYHLLMLECDIFTIHTFCKK